MMLPDLSAKLEQYRSFYGEFNRDPAAWQAQHGPWPEYENLEKSRVIFEAGQILSLLHQITLKEGSLDTEGDLEYYSTVREGLAAIRAFLEHKVPS